MSDYGNQRRGTSASANDALGEPIFDSIGYPIFSDGKAGAIHVMVHRMLDSGQTSRGHRLLGDWLDNRDGRGSEWVHLQWHMAVLEVSLGRRQRALERFRRHILPAAVTSCDALTDAPAFLWRLSLEAGKHCCLPWEPVRHRALSSLQLPCSTFVHAHNMLALAGAGDTHNLDRWIDQKTQTDTLHADALLIRIARGLRWYISGRYADAAQALHGIAAAFSRGGGSRSQNELFTRLRESARCKAAAACTESGWAA